MVNIPWCHECDNPDGLCTCKKPHPGVPMTDSPTPAEMTTTPDALRKRSIAVYLATSPENGHDDISAHLKSAADLIDSQRAALDAARERVKELEAALEPFTFYTDFGDELLSLSDDKKASAIELACFRNAKAALAPDRQGE